MYRALPPTAAPLQFRSLLSGVFSTFGHGAETAFRDQIRAYFKVKHVFLVSSGKAALYFSLRAVQQSSKRKEVVIPAYSSFCLASAVARAGLPVKLCDIDPDTLDFDLDKLRSAVTERTLAVIPVHNYGLVCNLREIQRIAVEKGAFVVEDAAQAAGALFENRKVGALGDVGILSLGRGKNIGALGGGVILTDREPLASLIDELLALYPQESSLSEYSSLLKGAASGLFLHPESYALPAHLPFLNLGTNVFDPDFKIARLSNLNAEVGRRAFSSLDSYNDIRKRNARLLSHNLGYNESVRIPKPLIAGQPVYLRFPIVFPKKETRRRASWILNRRRLGANRSYLTPLNEIPPFRTSLCAEDDYPGAKFVAERILTLPTHPYVNEQDIKRIVSRIGKVT
ncbi:MAG TPA: aminotransferase class V-fold PLP-dependent enzyme [Thermodesulfobacteriota bacterium]|nr:aminotransferase class V-fold PLP-dependent enzyme [Thermodesulfobacteriota bacterium]